MPITIGAKRRWTVLIIVNESTVSQSPRLSAGRGVWGEGAAFEPPCPTQSRRDLPGDARSCVILPGFVAALAAHRFTVEFDAVSRSRMESAIVGSPICACQDATGSWLVSSTERAW